MAKHELGDRPIIEAQRETLNHVARQLDLVLNGAAKGADRKVGFVLLTFPFSETDGRCNYISNGADRRDIATMFREQIARLEGLPEARGTA